MQIRNVALLSTLAGLLVGACTGDPNDPMTWARKLSNVREQQEALNQLARMGAERLPCTTDARPEREDFCDRAEDAGVEPADRQELAHHP